MKREIYLEKMKKKIYHMKLFIADPKRKAEARRKYTHMLKLTKIQLRSKVELFQIPVVKVSKNKLINNDY